MGTGGHVHKSCQYRGFDSEWQQGFCMLAAGASAGRHALLEREDGKKLNESGKQAESVAVVEWRREGWGWGCWFCWFGLSHICVVRGS